MGFDAIWISPISKQVEDQTRAYHGYSQVDIFQLNNHFGSSDDLMTLSSALHEREMYLMVDVVVNHFASEDSAQTVDYNIFNPFSTISDFHSICWNEEQESDLANMQLCWLGNENYPLPDVNTTQTGVRDAYRLWIQELIANYSIDGLRIDTVKNVEPDFFPEFQESASVYAVGEVADGNVDFACPYQNYVDGILNYPGYITKSFPSKSCVSDVCISERSISKLI